MAQRFDFDNLPYVKFLSESCLKTIDTIKLSDEKEVEYAVMEKQLRAEKPNSKTSTEHLAFSLLAHDFINDQVAQETFNEAILPLSKEKSFVPAALLKPVFKMLTNPFFRSEEKNETSSVVNSLPDKKTKKIFKYKLYLNILSIKPLSIEDKRLRQAALWQCLLPATYLGAIYNTPNGILKITPDLITSTNKRNIAMSLATDVRNHGLLLDNATEALLAPREVQAQQGYTVSHHSTLVCELFDSGSMGSDNMYLHETLVHHFQNRRPKKTKITYGKLSDGFFTNRGDQIQQDWNQSANAFPYQNYTTPNGK